MVFIIGIHYAVHAAVLSERASVQIPVLFLSRPAQGNRCHVPVRKRISTDGVIAGPCRLVIDIGSRIKRVPHQLHIIIRNILFVHCNELRHPNPFLCLRAVSGRIPAGRQRQRQDRRRSQGADFPEYPMSFSVLHKLYPFFP